MHAMTLIRIAAPLSLFALSACGSSETPQAAPGAVERTTAELDRNEAAGRRDTVRRIEREAEARSDRFDDRIEAIEREKAAKN